MGVYLLSEPSWTYIKVGFTQDEKSLRGRIKSIQTGSPLSLFLLAWNPRMTMKDEQRIIEAIKQHRSGGGSEWFLLENCIGFLSKYFDVSKYTDRNKPAFFNKEFSEYEIENLLESTDECHFTEQTFYNFFYTAAMASDCVDEIEVMDGLKLSSSLPHFSGDTKCRKEIPQDWEEFTEKSFYNYMPLPESFWNEAESAIAMLLSKRAFESFIAQDSSMEYVPIVTGSDTNFLRIFYSDSKQLHDYCREFSERFWFDYDCFAINLMSMIVDSSGEVTSYGTFGNAYNKVTGEFVA